MHWGRGSVWQKVIAPGVHIKQGVLVKYDPFVSPAEVDLSRVFLVLCCEVAAVRKRSAPQGSSIFEIFEISIGLVFDGIIGPSSACSQLSEVLDQGFSPRPR